MGRALPTQAIMLGDEDAVRSNRASSWQVSDQQIAGGFSAPCRAAVAGILLVLQAISWTSSLLCEALFACVDVIEWAVSRETAERLPSSWFGWPLYAIAARLMLRRALAHDDPKHELPTGYASSDA